MGQILLDSCDFFPYFCFLLCFSSFSLSAVHFLSSCFCTSYTFLISVKSVFPNAPSLLSSACQECPLLCFLLLPGLFFFLCLSPPTDHPLSSPSTCYQKLLVVNRIPQASNFILDGLTTGGRCFPQEAPPLRQDGLTDLTESPGSHPHRKQSTAVMVPIHIKASPDGASQAPGG